MNRPKTGSSSNRPHNNVEVSEAELREKALINSEEKLLDMILPRQFSPSANTQPLTKRQDDRSHSIREKLRNQLRSGKLDPRQLDVHFVAHESERRPWLSSILRLLENRDIVPGMTIGQSLQLAFDTKDFATGDLTINYQTMVEDLRYVLGLTRRTVRMTVSDTRQFLFENELRALSMISRIEEQEHLLPSSEGNIQVVQNNLLQFLSSDPEAIYRMTPRQFEETILEILLKLGFHADLTLQTRDGGCDVIAVRKDELGITTKYIVEAKHYKPPHRVGVGIIRQLNTVRQKEGGHHGILVTSSYFTADAVTENRIYYGLHLRDYDALLQWINSAATGNRTSILS